jgi:uncharacterized peroxidase-related enzyme
MSRLTAINPEHSTGKTNDLFTDIQKKLGFVPNMMRTMANSPYLLESYLNFSDTLGKGSIGAKLGEQIALVIAEQNRCEYCLSAHTAIGKIIGLTDTTIDATRNGDPIDPKTDAAITFAKAVAKKRGRISDADLNAIKEVGFTQGEIIEIVGHVALNILTNYINNTAGTEIDFPKISLLEEASLS